VESRILLLYLLGVVALVLYAAQADFMMDKLRPMFEEARSADRYQGALTALWPTLFVCAVFPLVFIEISYAPMDVIRTLELDRIRRSTRSGALLATTCCLLFVLNYILDEYNKKVDLSYFKTTRPSESSKKMVKNLSEPVKAMLFFPGTNEVLDEALSFFDELKRESSRFTVKQVDQVMEPELAKDLSVSQNGTVVLVRGKQHQSISLGTKLKRAKRKLKKLDGEFQTAFRKLMKKQKVAYITVGHEERSKERRDGRKGTEIREVYNWLERLNFAVKDLGVGQGLASEVPADASVVIVPGPRRDFLPAELETLRRYLAGGGRMMLFLDPEADLTFEPLLKPFGLKFTPEKLANDKFYVKMTYTPADRHVLYSNRFSAHPTVTTLTRNAHRAAAIMLNAGYLEEVPPAAGTKPQVQFTIHSMPFTWNDINGNRIYESATEKRKVFELAAVVTMPVKENKPAPKKMKDKKDKKGKEEKPEMRLIVAADSDMIVDPLFRLSNGFFFLDGLKWLTGEEEIIGDTSSEEDVRIVHTRKEDQLWFYLTIFAVPLVVLGGGIYYTRRIRRRRKA
jgi:ABC-type uncharacterized transport system involved in gliding motility auxiliary subunit